MSSLVEPTGTTMPENDYEVIFKRPASMSGKPFHYCPGCSHGTYHRMIAELIDNNDLLGKTIGVCPVGCSVFGYDYFEFDMIQAAHGRAPAVATAVKRCLPDSFVFTYQGDGDLAAIGTAETVHAAARGENITIFFVNNGIFGMTGGQMAPTSLIGQKTTTSPCGRDAGLTGQPIKMSEMLATLDGAAYIARIALTSPKNVRQCKKHMQNALRVQQEKLGFSMIEVLSPCPVQWGMTPGDAMDYIEDEVLKIYPPGVFVNKLPEPAKKG